MISKTCASAAAALADVPDGATVMIGGFGGSGLPTLLIDALLDVGARGLSIISNNVGGTDYGVGRLIANRQVARVTCSFPVGRSRARLQDVFWEQFDSEALRVRALPQGTLAEAIRAGGAGVPAFFTPAGVGTSSTAGREVRRFDGRDYVLQTALRADFALVRAATADRMGNLRYRKAMRNFNPVMAAAARVTVAQVDAVLPLEDTDPETVDTPGVYIDRVVAA